MEEKTRPVVLLIHGYGFDHRIWYPVEVAFNGFHVLYLSLPGFGEEVFAGSYTIEQLAGHYWDQIADRAGSGNVHLVGHSMGGYICIEMASQQPERISSLSLIHSHVFEDTAERKSVRTSTLEEIQAHGKHAFAERMISGLLGGETPESSTLKALLLARGLQYSDEAWYWGTQAIRDRRDHRETFQHLSVPVLLVMGGNDKVVPTELIYRQAAMVDRAELVVFPGVGHLSMYECTADLIHHLRTFFSPFLS